MGGRTERELLARLMHDIWIGWARHMIDCLTKDPRRMPEVWIERWERQIATTYAGLTEPEKESDRLEADKVLALVVGLQVADRRVVEAVMVLRDWLEDVERSEKDVRCEVRRLLTALCDCERAWALAEVE